MDKEQKEIYYASGKSVELIERMPKVEGLKQKGIEVLYLTDQIDEFVMKGLSEYDGHKLTPAVIAGEKTEDESYKGLLEFMTGALEGKVKDVRLNDGLGSYPSCISAEGEISLEMERILSSMPNGKDIKATRIMEINLAHPLIERAKQLLDVDNEKLAKLTKILYGEALLLAGLEMADSNDFVTTLNEII